MNTLSAHQDFLIKRASQNDRYLAYSIMNYALSSNLTINSLQQELNCDNDSFVKLILCRRIVFGEVNFQQGVQQIADYTGIDVIKLISLLKRLSVLSVFSQGHKNTVHAPFSYVAAAREKDTKVIPPQKSDDV